MPLDDLVAMVERVRAPVVMLSASGEESARVLREWAAALRAPGVGEGNPIIVFGGRVFLENPTLRSMIDGVYFGDDGRDIVHQMYRVFAVELA